MSLTSPKRTLSTCCSAHILHDGLSDVSYVLLIAAYLRIQTNYALPQRRYRAWGGKYSAWTTLGLTIVILISCMQLDATTIVSIGGFYVIAASVFLLSSSRRAAPDTV